MSKFRVEGMSAMRPAEKQVFVDKFTNWVTAEKKKARELVEQYAETPPSNILEAENIIRQRLSEKWQHHTKDPVPEPTSYYVPTERWSEYISRVGIEGESGGFHNAPASMTVLQYGKNNYPLATIRSQAHELSRAFARHSVFIGKNGVEVRKASKFLEESFATSHEIGLGTQVAMEVEGHDRIMRQLSNARADLMSLGRQKPWEINYVYPENDVVTAQSAYATAHFVTDKVFKGTDGWSLLEACRIKADYGPIHSLIDGRWGKGTYELIKACPTDSDSALLLSDYLDGDIIKRASLAEKIIARTKLK